MHALTRPEVTQVRKINTMSLIKENYQDEHGNWLPEAEEILAKATATQTTNKGTRTLLSLNKPEDFSTERNDVKPRTTMNIELNTVELDILHHAVETLHRTMGFYLVLMGWTADAKELETKLAEALKNSHIASEGCGSHDSLTNLARNAEE
jgi:hypothetical protein